MKNKKLNIILIIILTLVCLYFVLRDDYAQIIKLLFNVNIFWLIISVLLVISYTFLKSVVTNNIINVFKPYSVIKTFKLQMMTFFFNSITPFSTGGQPFQIYILNKDGFSLSSSTNVVLKESIIHQLSVSIVFLITILLNYMFNVYNLNFTLNLLLFLGFLINTIVLIILFILAYAKKVDNTFINITAKILYKLRIIKDKEEKIKKWESNVKEFNMASRSLIKNKKNFLGLIFLNSLAIICFYIVPLTVLFSLGNFTAFDGICAIVISSFVSIISCYVPLPGGALGQEYLFNLFFSIYVSSPLINSLLILWRTVTYYIPVIIGAIIFSINNRN